MRSKVESGRGRGRNWPSKYLAKKTVYICVPKILVLNILELRNQSNLVIAILPTFAQLCLLGLCDGGKGLGEN